jgi:hypothetical protein
MFSSLPMKSPSGTDTDSPDSYRHDVTIHHSLLDTNNKQQPTTNSADQTHARHPKDSYSNLTTATTPTTES